MKSGTRVKVTSGDGQTQMGEGTYMGDVEVNVFWSEAEGVMKSLSDAQSKPTDEIVAEMKSQGYEYELFGESPKIILDSGETVYGCQVWWTPIKDEK